MSNFKKRILMIGTDPAGKGGIASVVSTYDIHGIFSKLGVRYVSTHTDAGLLKKFFAFFGAVFVVYFYFLSKQASVLHVHLASRGSFYRKCFFVWPAYLFRVPVVLHLHGGEFQVFYEKECGFIVKKLVRSTFKKADFVVVLSMSWADWVKKSFAQNKVMVIENPVILPNCNRRENDVYFNIVFMGKVSEKKGVFDLVEVFSSVVDDLPDARLIVAGEGDVEKLKNIVCAKQIENKVEIVGWVSGAEKITILNNASVFVLPSYNEGLPIGLLEAMSYGVPVIASNVGGIPELISDEINGCLIDPGDLGLLKSHIELFYMDKLRAKKIGDAGYFEVKNRYHADISLNKLHAIYCEVVKNEI